MSEAIDQPTTVRAGEALDITKLKTYLEEELGIVGPIQVAQFPSGFSNLTYFVEAGGKEMVLRRPPFGANIKSAHDMGREHKVLSLLKPIYPYVPKVIAYEPTGKVLGAAFYLMERVRGVILRNRPPKDISLTPDLMKAVSERFTDHLADLHTIDVEANGLTDMGKPAGYTQRQVDGWVKRYGQSETDTIEQMNETALWLKAHVPVTKYRSMIHNDYKYDNLVLNPSDLTDVTAVLDWEMATIGDPLMDLGTTLAYWCEASDSDALKPFNLSWLPGNLTREQIAERYLSRTGFEVADLVFYYAFGAFKVGVIVQQIYARYKKGLTQDPRFAPLIHVVRACAHNAAKAIEAGKISGF